LVRYDLFRYKTPVSAVPGFEFLYILSGAPAAVDAVRSFKHAESFTGYLLSLSLGEVFAVKAIYKSEIACPCITQRFRVGTDVKKMIGNQRPVCGLGEVGVCGYLL